MSPSSNSRPEQPNTYFVQDRSDQEELTRLQIQDHMTTMAMGGVLPEQPDPTMFQRVLDVGCGAGDWLLEAARAYPTASLLVGGDISNKMIEYARTQARVQQVSDRVEFHVMDAFLSFAFPADFFDLTNLRYGWSYLRTGDWPRLLGEFKRVTQTEGVIRITESDMIQSSGPALASLLELVRRAFYQAGHFFTPEGNGVTIELVRLLSQQGLQHVQTRAHVLKYHAGTPEGQFFYDDMKLLFRTILPFLRKWTRVPDDYEHMYQQALHEIQQPGFVATWNLLTAWGINPAK